jgi:hypothetical protein
MTEKNTQKNHSLGKFLNSYRDIVFLFFTILIITILRFPFLDVPLERDEGAYAYMAQLILEGIPPYTEAYSLYFPGIFIIYALGFLVFGQTIFAIHFSLLIANLITIVFIFLIGKKLYNFGTGVISAATLGLLGLNPYAQGLFSHGEPFTMLFICSGVYFLLLGVGSKKKILFICSGIFFGLGLLVKQNVLIFAGFPVAYLCWVLFKNFKQSNNFCYGALLFFIFGYFIPLSILSIFFLITGSWDQVLFWTFIMPSEMTPPISISRLIHQFKILPIPIIKVSPLFFGLAAIGFLSPLFDKKSRSPTTFIIVFWIFSFFTMCVAFYLRSHYFLYLFPATALLVGIGFNSIYFLIKKLHLIKLNNFIIISIVLLFFTFSILDQRKFLFQTTPEALSRDVYGGNPFPESLVIADYIKEHSSPDDKIAILGSEPQIFFYADRISATKHIFTYYLMGNHQHAISMQKEAMNDIELSKPPILINVVIPTSWLFQKDSMSMIFNWLESFVSRHYKLVGIVEIQNTKTTNYYWGEDIIKFSPKADNFIQIYQRKNIS